MSVLDIFGLGGKILDKFVQGRAERMRNRIDALERERDAIIEKGRLSGADYSRLRDVLDRLHAAERSLANRD